MHVVVPINTTHVFVKIYPPVLVPSMGTKLAPPVINEFWLVHRYVAWFEEASNTMQYCMVQYIIH